MLSTETLGIEAKDVQLVEYSEGPLEKQKVFEYRGLISLGRSMFMSQGFIPLFVRGLF